MPTTRNTRASSVRLVSINTAAGYLGVSERYVQRLLRRGDFGARKLGGRTMIALSDLEAFADNLPAARFRPLPTAA